MLAMSSMLMNQQSISNKVSIDRNTHKTRLCIDRSMPLFSVMILDSEGFVF